MLSRTSFSARTFTSHRQRSSHSRYVPTPRLDTDHRADALVSCPRFQNTLNGQIFPQDEIVKISENVKREGIIMHLDGARCGLAADLFGSDLS